MGCKVVPTKPAKTFQTKTSFDYFEICVFFFLERESPDPTLYYSTTKCLNDKCYKSIVSQNNLALCPSQIVNEGRTVSTTTHTKRHLQTFLSFSFQRESFEQSYNQNHMEEHLSSLERYEITRVHKNLEIVHATPPTSLPRLCIQVSNSSNKYGYHIHDALLLCSVDMSSVILLFCRFSIQKSKVSLF